MTANSSSLREVISPRHARNRPQIDPWYRFLDLALVVTSVLLVFIDATVFLFHVIFILLTVGAFFWKLRPFAIRAVIWVTFASVIVLNAVLAREIAIDEFIEIPLLTIILLVVFGIARQRTKAEEALRKTNDELETRVTERTIELTQVNAELMDAIAQHKHIADTLRESKERYRRLVELSFDAIAIYSNGRFVDINPAGAQLLGAADPKAIIGKPIRDFVHPDYWESAQERIQRTNAGVASVPLVEEKLVRLNGTSVDVETAGISITYEAQPAVQVVIRDLTMRKEAEQERQRERTRMARNLHDSLGHSLGYLHLKLDQLANGQTRDGVTVPRPEIVQMRDVANEAYEIVRGMLAALLPVNSTDLATALLMRTRSVSQRGGFKVTVATKGQPIALHPITQQGILYLFQEALNNVEKHANAKSVHLVLLWTTDTLTIAMSDDGLGFNIDTLQANGHHGLRIMQERAREMDAQLTVSSSPASGTEVMLQLALNPDLQRVTG
jgi:PAS domain S-box-containing protein